MTEMVETATVVEADITGVKNAKVQKAAFAKLASLLAMPSIRWNMSDMVHTFANVVKKEKHHAKV